MVLSFIIPVFNAELYIDKCLTSILTQSEGGFEVLVIDDCSTDTTTEKLAAYESGDQRVRVFSNPKNSLAGHCRNTGINNALGDYLWFVDADDWIDPNSVSQILKIINENREEQILSFGYAEHHADQGASIIYRIPVPDHDPREPLANFLLIRRGYSSMPFSYLFRRDFLLSNTLYFPVEIYFEDLLFMCKAFYFAEKVKLIPRVFYNYNRTNNHSITLFQSKRKILDLLQIYEGLLGFLESRRVLLKYQDLLAYRFLVYGLPRCFRMFMKLARKDRKDKALRYTLLKYKRSDLMQLKAIRDALFMVNKHSRDPFQKMEFIANLRYLIIIKYALRILELKRDLTIAFEKSKRIFMNDP